MGLKCNLNSLTYLPPSKLKGEKLYQKVISKDSYSPKKLCEFFKMYSDGRKIKHPFFAVLDDASSAIFSNCRLKIFENKDGNMLAGYVYKLRKNSLDEKSMYIDALARNKTDSFDNNSRNIMTTVFEDIKKTAVQKKRKEITLFVYASDKNLRYYYEKLGFKLDSKNDIKKVYLMRVRVKDFLENTYFKLRKYKEALGIDSILRNKQ